MRAGMQQAATFISNALRLQRAAALFTAFAAFCHYAWRCTLIPSLFIHRLHCRWHPAAFVPLASALHIFLRPARHGAQILAFSDRRLWAVARRRGAAVALPCCSPLGTAISTILFACLLSKTAYCYASSGRTFGLFAHFFSRAAWATGADAHSMACAGGLAGLISPRRRTPASLHRGAAIPMPNARVTYRGRTAWR